MILDNHLALSYLPLKKGEVFALPGTTCYMYIINSGQVQTYLYQMA